MGRTQKHQPKCAAALDSEHDLSVDGTEGDNVTLATVRKLLKVQESESCAFQRTGDFEIL